MGWSEFLSISFCIFVMISRSFLWWVEETDSAFPQVQFSLIDKPPSWVSNKNHFCLKCNSAWRKFQEKMSHVYLIFLNATCEISLVALRKAPWLNCLEGLVRTHVEWTGRRSLVRGEGRRQGWQWVRGGGAVEDHHHILFLLRSCSLVYWIWVDQPLWH